MTQSDVDNASIPRYSDDENNDVDYEKAIQITGRLSPLWRPFPHWAIGRVAEIIHGIHGITVEQVLHSQGS